MVKESAGGPAVAPDTGTPPVCPHCGASMRRMQVPPLANFESPWIWVCFNDECGYFRRGWDWMWSHYRAHASYRHKIDPFTGESGPLPVWSENALKANLLDEQPTEGREDEHA